MKTIMRGSALAFAAALSTAAGAQDTIESGDAPPPEPVEIVPPGQSTAGGRDVYTLADFTRFAPRTALDMLEQIPGFSIRNSESRRGLGGATGNILFNGQRPSNKSDELTTQLSRIPAGNVERIEIVDGASLDIPGLTGEVANVVYRADALTGQFQWRPEVRPHYADPLLFYGAVSISGRAGDLQYEAGVDNTDAYRGAAGGPNTFTDGAGVLLERRDNVARNNYDAPKFSGRVTWDGPGDSVGHAQAHYQIVRERNTSDIDRFEVGADPRYRRIVSRARGWNWEASGDYEFGVGPGRLKLIGLHNYAYEPYDQTLLEGPAGADFDSGDRFARTGRAQEDIVRAEYTWKMLGGDWQAAGEAAFNSLDSVSTLGSFDPLTGEFAAVDFEGGTGGVKEDRYDGSLSYSRPLSKTLSLQLVGAFEKSTISQTTPGGITRTFTRPKGSASVAWKPSSDFDVSLKVERRVLQLDFYDFLAQAFLGDGNQNSGNTDLRPRQDWSYTAEINKKLGRWGATKLNLIYRDVQDLVELVPVGDGESIGNIPKSKAAALDWTSTLELEPLGWKGAKLDTRLLLQKSRLRDPFTGEKRQWGGFTTRVAEINLRHDIPGSDWAWGGFLYNERNLPEYRRSERDRHWEGPFFSGLFVENKDVLGLTVKAEARNLLNSRNRRVRTVYADLRDASPILFREDRNRLIGPIFRFEVTGSF